MSTFSQFNRTPVSIITGATGENEVFQKDFQFNLPPAWNDFEIWWDASVKWVHLVMKNADKVSIQVGAYWSGCDQYMCQSHTSQNYDGCVKWLAPINPAEELIANEILGWDKLTEIKMQQGQLSLRYLEKGIMYDLKMDGMIEKESGEGSVKPSSYIIFKGKKEEFNHD